MTPMIAGQRFRILAANHWFHHDFTVIAATDRFVTIEEHSGERFSMTRIRFESCRTAGVFEEASVS